MRVAVLRVCGQRTIRRVLSMDGRLAVVRGSVGRDYWGFTVLLLLNQYGSLARGGAAALDAADAPRRRRAHGCCIAATACWVSTAVAPSTRGPKC